MHSYAVICLTASQGRCRGERYTYWGKRGEAKAFLFVGTKETKETKKCSKLWVIPCWKSVGKGVRPVGGIAFRTVLQRLVQHCNCRKKLCLIFLSKVKNPGSVAMYTNALGVYLPSMKVAYCISQNFHYTHWWSYKMNIFWRNFFFSMRHCFKPCYQLRLE